MLVRGREPSKFRIEESEIYAKELLVLTQRYPDFDINLILNMEFELARDPRGSGIRLREAFPDKKLYVTVTSEGRETPALRLLYEVSDDIVTLWHISSKTNETSSR